MRFRVGVGEVAGRLSADGRHAVVEEGEGVHVLARLNGEFGGVHGAPVEAGGRSRLEAADGVAELFQIFGEQGRPCKSVRTVFRNDVPRNGARAEVNARRHDDGAAGEYAAVRGHNARHAPVFRQDLRRLALRDAQVLGVFQDPLHLGVVAVFVRLGAQRLHCRALALVEHTVLQGGAVGVESHFAAERVDLAHQMPLRRAADGGVAGHKADAVQIQSEDDRIQTRAGKREGGFAPRVTCADDHGVVRSFGKKLFHGINMQKSRKGIFLA